MPQDDTQPHPHGHSHQIQRNVSTMRFWINICRLIWRRVDDWFCAHAIEFLVEPGHKNINVADTGSETIIEDLRNGCPIVFKCRLWSFLRLVQWLKYPLVTRYFLSGLEEGTVLCIVDTSTRLRLLCAWPWKIYWVICMCWTRRWSTR